jgi:hypothetical protein
LRGRSGATRPPCNPRRGKRARKRTPEQNAQARTHLGSWRGAGARARPYVSKRYPRARFLPRAISSR